jgi:hypothetical protein
MSDSPHPIRLLTVDAAGTLVRPWPSVGAVYGRTAREYGIDAADEDVDKNFYQAFGKLQVCKKTNGGEEKISTLYSKICGISLPVGIAGNWLKAQWIP